MFAALAALLATEARAQTGTTPIGIEQGDYLCVRTPHTNLAALSICGPPARRWRAGRGGAWSGALVEG